MGVQVTTINPGNGEKPKKGDKVVIHYKGTMIEHDGTEGNVFDSTWEYNQPFTTEIGTGKVIKGWDEGILKLSKGEKATLLCSSDYAYGSRGYPPDIPANTKLKFEIELLEIIRRKE